MLELVIVGPLEASIRRAAVTSEKKPLFEAFLSGTTAQAAFAAGHVPNPTVQTTIITNFGLHSGDALHVGGRAALNKLNIRTLSLDASRLSLNIDSLRAEKSWKLNAERITQQVQKYGGTFVDAPLSIRGTKTLAASAAFFSGQMFFNAQTRDSFIELSQQFRRQGAPVIVDVDLDNPAKLKDTELLAKNCDVLRIREKSLPYLFHDYVKNDDVADYRVADTLLKMGAPLVYITSRLHGHGFRLGDQIKTRFTGQTEGKHEVNEPVTRYRSLHISNDLPKNSLGLDDVSFGLGLAFACLEKGITSAGSTKRGEQPRKIDDLLKTEKGDLVDSIAGRAITINHNMRAHEDALRPIATGPTLESILAQSSPA